MNTGLTSITAKLPEAQPIRPNTPVAAGKEGLAPNAADQTSLPVNSNASTAGISARGNNQAENTREKPSLEEVIEISDKLNESVQRIQRDLNFSVDDTQGDIVVQVVDRKTQEVIKQIPSEEMLNLSRSIEEVNSLLFDKIKA